MLLNREHPAGAKLAREPEFGAFAMASQGATVRGPVICIRRLLRVRGFQGGALLGPQDRDYDDRV